MTILKKVTSKSHAKDEKLHKYDDHINELSKDVVNLGIEKTKLENEIDLQDQKIADLECEYFEINGHWPCGYPASATRKYRPKFVKIFP